MLTGFARAPGELAKRATARSLLLSILIRAVPIQTLSWSLSLLFIVCLLMWQYIYERGREKNQDSKSYLDSKSSRKSRMNARETSRPYKPK